LENWSKIEYIFTSKLHVPPSELERLEYYRIAFLLKEYQEDIERQNREAEKQNKSAGTAKQSSQLPKTPNLPSYGDYKMPKMEMPKMQLPTFKH
jgi:hypothetical protein